MRISHFSIYCDGRGDNHHAMGRGRDIRLPYTQKDSSRLHRRLQDKIHHIQRTDGREGREMTLATTRGVHRCFCTNILRMPPRAASLTAGE